jgi:hypothetical protein
MVLSHLMLSLAACAALASAHENGHEEDLSAQYNIVAEVLNNKMPTPLSDHTATLVGTKVYIAGGCDDPNGNTWDTSGKAFYCGSVSNKFFVFDIVSQTFTNLTDMPVKRYRHAAAATNGKIWVHGGRSLFDDIITQLLVSAICQGPATLADILTLMDSSVIDY